MEEGHQLFGLIGYPLAHSSSAVYHNEKFLAAGDTNKEYRLFPLSDIAQFPDLLAGSPDLSGLNVTIPYKESIIPYLDELDEEARIIGAVNTIKVTRNCGKTLTKGFNTDTPGFIMSFNAHPPPGPALVLGTGGASKAIARALSLMEIPFNFVSRSHGRPGIYSYSGLTGEVIKNHPLIINTTPLGMYPDTANCPPIPYEFLSDEHFLYDLIYNPEETEFIRRGIAAHARTQNGRQMFIHQAELSRRIFLNIR
ncbi:MAG: shikimate dehydrogenase [bacterium]